MSEDMNNTAQHASERLSEKAPQEDSAGPSTSVDAPDPVLAAEALHGQVLDVLKTVFDPEIPIDIHELGLIYNVDVDDESNVKIDMTLTSPACPVAGSLPAEVQYKVANIPDVKDVEIELVWDPPWTPDRMSEAAKLELNMW